MIRPTVNRLPDDLRRVAVAMAERLEEAGFQAWLVGGAVRDLALGVPPGDVDLATDALPEAVEGLFEHTTSVGRAFGTVIVHDVLGDEVDSKRYSFGVEVTTFRSDGAYLDGRRPDDVTYGSSAEEDAQRRDFTCNALYLDPLTDEFLDPEQGLEDLRAGRLRCVGEASQRFAEDGLRLLRLVRFEARFALEPVVTTLEGARAARLSLSGVSPERVLAELEGIFASGDPCRALRRLQELDLLELAVPGVSGLIDEGESGAQRGDLLCAALSHLGGGLPLELGLALLLEPDPRWTHSEAADQRALSFAEDLLGRLHPSRKLRKAVVHCWMGRVELRMLLAAASPTRADRLLLTRREEWPLVLRTTRAWWEAGSGQLGAAARVLLDDLEKERDGLTRAELFPEPLLRSEDLARAGIDRGPRWGELLGEAERLQLNGELLDREAAVSWLAALDEPRSHGD